MILVKKCLAEKKFVIILLVIVFVFSLPQISLGQAGDIKNDNVRKGALKFFLDCRSCDMNYTRQEIPYVNYVRDTHEAQVYLLITNQFAGSGGSQYTYTFQGQGEFKGMNDTLVYTSNPDETSSEIRAKKTNLMKMGLMRYVARTPVFSEIEIKNNAALAQEAVVDKWNNWVFKLQTSPYFSAEESYKRFSFYNSIYITKITPELKLEVQLNQYNNKQKFIEDGVETVYVVNEKSIDNLFVKSFGAHWSAGVKWDLGASTSENYDLHTDFMPSIEYDIFPYSEATHRQFRLLYSVGYEYSNYVDSSIFNKTSEGLYKHRASIAYQVQEKWGSVNVSFSGSNYLHDFSKNKLEMWGFMRLRIIKGLSLSVNGGIAYINDQLNLIKGDLSEAERLLRLKEQATNFSIHGGVSISYTFGSIYNNVVNPRFGNGGNGGGGGNYY
jgi:hypothetical protein